MLIIIMLIIYVIYYMYVITLTSCYMVIVCYVDDAEQGAKKLMSKLDLCHLT